jgi:homeodomain-containing protein
MPEAKVVPVALSGAGRDRLTKVVSAGAHPARMIMRARVLLALDGNDGSPAKRAVVARQIAVSETTVRSVAERFVETGGDVEATITRKRRATPPVPSVITGEVEARLIALACSTPPPGHARWSLRLLEQQVGLIEELPDLDHSTIGRVLKKRDFVLI